MSDLLLMASSPLRSLLSTSGTVALYDPGRQIATGTTGQVLTDYSGRGNHARLGSTSGDDSNDPAWSDNALVFGGDDSVLIPAMSNLRSFGLWCYVAEIPEESQVMLCSSDLNISIGFYKGNSFILRCGYSGGDQRRCDLANFSAGQWNFVAVNYTSSGVPTVFINGIEAGYLSDNVWNINAGTSYLGRRSHTSIPLYFTGSIGSTYLFNRELQFVEWERVRRASGALWGYLS